MYPQPMDVQPISIKLDKTPVKSVARVVIVTSKRKSPWALCIAMHNDVASMQHLQKSLPCCIEKRDMTQLTKKALMFAHVLIDLGSPCARLSAKKDAVAYMMLHTDAYSTRSTWSQRKHDFYWFLHISSLLDVNRFAPSVSPLAIIDQAPASTSSWDLGGRKVSCAAIADWSRLKNPDNSICFESETMFDWLQTINGKVINE